MSRPKERVTSPADEGHADDRASATVRPIQLAAGFGIIAALILLALRRRRGRQD